MRAIGSGEGSSKKHLVVLDYLRASRPSHWLKNVLVFLPLVAGHRLYEPASSWRAAVAWLAFTCCAASIYFFNDLRDVAADRRDPAKRLRPLASGRITPFGSEVAMALTAAAGAAVGWTLGGACVAVLGLYYVLMIVYSLGAKSVPILDVVLLACGYALRVVMGSVATGMSWSPWLTAFCVFLFLSLALIKRYAELSRAEPSPDGEAHVRGYVPQDGVLLVAQGLASGYVSVLVLALYTNARLVQAPTGRYPLFWLICLLLLYWISHMWLMAHRGRIREDPVAYACRDRVSRLLVAAAVVVALFAV
ncbi:MAG TPA: UbiA family prenyltransferase [Steroidobacteraceae bacterium]|nr:UbiA family prenyltransferase [Steroidobacteraceae bacterium]